MASNTRNPQRLRHLLAILHTPFDYPLQPESECESLDQQARVFPNHSAFENEGLALRHDAYGSLGQPLVQSATSGFNYPPYSPHPGGQDVQ